MASMASGIMRNQSTHTGTCNGNKHSKNAYANEKCLSGNTSAQLLDTQAKRPNALEQCPKHKQ